MIGICRAAGDAYADPADKAGKLFAVDVEPVKKLKSPVTLAAIKADKRFATFVLTRVPRLSVMPVSDEEWKRILEMSESDGRELPTCAGGFSNRTAQRRQRDPHRVRVAV